MIVTVQFIASDEVIDWCIADLLRSTPPSKISRRRVIRRAREVYETYGGQANGGTADEAGFYDLEDEMVDDEYDTIQKVRARIGL